MAVTLENCYIDRNSLIPRYAQLAQYLSDAITRGAFTPGEQLPGENEIASCLQLSRMTVRSALSLLEDRRLITRIHGKGTFVSCQSVSTPNSIDVFLEISYTYFAAYYIQSISDVLKQNNCRFVIHDTRNSQEEITSIIHQIVHNGSSGVILQPSHETTSLIPSLREAFTLLTAKRIPYIMLDHAYDGIPGHRVVFDDYGGGKIAAEHLVSLGHRNCVMVGFHQYYEHPPRRDGFNEVLLQNNLAPLMEIGVDGELNEHLVDAVRTKGVTAVFCFNDEVAILCMRALYEAGLRIPEDVSVVGYDDTFIATATNPPLTSVIHPKDVLGRMAAEKLISLINGASYEPDPRLIEPRIHIRASSGKVKKDV